MDALKDYTCELTNAKTSLERLNQFINDNGEINPEQVTWANVGDMARIAAMLKDIQNIIEGKAR